MKHLTAAILTIAVVTAAPPQPYPGQVTQRGRTWWHVQGQPARNILRWWFSGVPMPPKEVPAEKAN